MARAFDDHLEFVPDFCIQCVFNICILTSSTKILREFFYEKTCPLCTRYWRNDEAFTIMALSKSIERKIIFVSGRIIILVWD